MSEYITDDTEISFDSDGEISNGENSGKKVLMKEIKYRSRLVFVFEVVGVILSLS